MFENRLQIFALFTRAINAVKDVNLIDRTTDVLFNIAKVLLEPFYDKPTYAVVWHKSDLRNV